MEEAKSVRGVGVVLALKCGELIELCDSDRGDDGALCCPCDAPAPAPSSSNGTVMDADAPTDGESGGGGRSAVETEVETEEEVVLACAVLDDG
jgi:hypothetical protein